MIISPSIINEAVSVLLAGGVIAHATDTCYGFACDIFNEAALAKLYELKGMSFDKPVSILVSSLAEAEGYAEFSDSARVLAQQYWPGALTLVLPRKHTPPVLERPQVGLRPTLPVLGRPQVGLRPTLPAFLNPQTQSVGIRVPNHELSHALVKLLGRPITTTSANVTTLPSPYTAQAIRDQFLDRKIKPDFILDSGTLSEKNLPSTIIDMTGEKPRIIRQGSLVVPEISI